MDDKTRRQHLAFSKKCDPIEHVLKLQFLLADREEALTVARHQRDEARTALRFNPLASTRP
jgi:hypothetical protein